MKKYCLFFLLFFLYPRQILAVSTDQIITVVNPVRGRNLWESHESVKRQIDLIVENKIPSTWLFQYDLLTDEENFRLFENLPLDQELGVFLEVSEELATDADVPYLFGDGDWARPDKILLSGYNPAERRRLIDKIFETFKKKIGHYPSSVGAWYIDTLSLNYMSAKYHIKALLDVADQYSTDKYGLWGKPWGTAYIPSLFSSLLPAKTKDEALDIVKIQWAQRDPVKGFGLSASDSIYSLQANDYINNKLNNDYFKKLSQLYLSADGPVAQLTIGLEAGQEGAAFIEEYKRQIQYLLNLADEGKIKFLSMNDFAQLYKTKSSGTNTVYFISGADYSDSSIEAYWYSSMFYRIGFIKSDDSLIIRDFRVYPDYLFFEDLYTNDANHNLKRIIPGAIDEAVSHNAKTVFSQITKFSAVKKEETVYIILQENNQNDHKILLSPDKIVIDSRIVFENPKTNGIGKKVKSLIAKSLLDYWVSYPHFWFGSVRFSNINSIYYFGFTPAPDILIGLKSEYPFLGSFKFPFQVLSRFKTFPGFDLAKLLSENLVKILNNSTIKVSGELQI